MIISCGNSLVVENLPHLVLKHHVQELVSFFVTFCPLYSYKISQFVGLKFQYRIIGSSGSEKRQEAGGDVSSPDSDLCDCIQVMLSMGFSYPRVIEAYSIFGDDVDSMVCYLIETSCSSRRKGKATE